MNRVVLLGVKGGPSIRAKGAMPTSSLLDLDGQLIVVDCGLGVTRGQRLANATGGADQPNAFAAPVGDRRVQRHAYRLVKDSVTSPSRTPNLDMVALFSITLSFTRYIQSSNCTS